MPRMDGKIAIVTGAARGIGLATARLLANEGAQVVLTDVDGTAGASAARALAADGARAEFLEHDVARDDAWRQVVADVRRRHDRIDVLVNNAGVYLIAPIAETSLDALHHVLRVNVDGTFLGMKHVAPVMAERGGGSIVNISSMDGILGAEGLAAYGASKAAVRLMTKDVAIEFARRGVRANSVHPGYIRTRMAEYGAEREGKPSVDALGEDFPMGRIGEPEDVAYGVLYLASDESRWVTGSELVIDGGATAGQR
jgi:NAD(P)-dependent dehydrogenase (short-subunit alcohol dehydrogenase family)